MGKLFSRVLVSWLALLLFGSLQGWAQTDVAVSAYGAFNQSTSGAGTVQSPSNQAGFLIEARHIRNPLVGYEATYAYNRANQAYSSFINPPCPIGGPSICGPTTKTAAIPANAHEFTADWVASLKLANLRPFALAGGGLLVDVPSGGTLTTITCGAHNALCSLSTTSAPTNTATKAVFVYGAGVDWTLLPHLGLRFQYRGNLYKAPALTKAFSSTGSFTHTAEPMVGAFFRF
ncbi:MAG: outer membrane beta-barrel protein [Acidobacteriaceae bacterium]